MRRNALQLSRRHKLALYGSTFLVFASGVLWWLMDTFLTTKDEFGGATKHPLQSWLLKAHGAGAMLILVMIGTLLPIHVKRGWLAGQNVRSGASILGVFALLTLTGYGLYYVGGEELRTWISQVHLWVGMIVPIGLGYHVWHGHWLRRHGRLRKQ